MAKRLWILTAAVLTAAGPAYAASPPRQPPLGLWMNPRASVVVRTGPCRARLCGWIAWANGTARADARTAGVAQLLGVELLQDYAAAGAGSWKGVVLVPDMGRRFSSRIDQLSPTRLQIKGCVLGGLICKSQVWTRIDRLPDA